MIKPRENSFVFEGDAIFKYLEDEPLEPFQETVAHEMHHIGYGTACDSSDAESLPAPKKALRKWLGAFGEGFAVLAASGGLHTVGWRTATAIERELGRDALIAAFCDHATLLATYNRAAEAREKRTGERLPR